MSTYPSEERCTYLKRLKDEDGRPAFDDSTMPILQRCKKRRAPDSQYCYTHESRRGVQLRDIENRVGYLLREMDLPVMNPMDGLLEAVRYSGQFVRMLQLMVGTLDTEPVSGETLLIGPDGDMQTVLRSRGLTGWNKDSEEVPNVLVQLYGTWLDRYTKACMLAVQAGLDERIIRNAEATTGSLYTAVARALTKIDLTLEQQASFKRALGEELRDLETGANFALEAGDPT